MTEEIVENEEALRLEEEEIRQHLREAQENKEKNSHRTEEFKKSLGGLGGIDPDALAKKLQGSLDEEVEKDEKKKAFRAKMKSHYKGEFNMAAALKQKPISDDEDEDEQK